MSKIPGQRRLEFGRLYVVDSDLIAAEKELNWFIKCCCVLA